MSTDRAILIGSGIIALSIIGSAYVSGSWPIVVVTLLLVLVTYVHARIMKRVEWFTGAMERHSDQMRQIMAKDANIEMYWWIKRKPMQVKVFLLRVPTTRSMNWKKFILVCRCTNEKNKLHDGGAGY